MPPAPPIILVAGGLLSTASLATDGRRVLDFLNDAGSAYLRIQDVQVSRLGAEQPHQLLSEALVPKASVTLIALPAEKHEAPEKRR